MPFSFANCVLDADKHSLTRAGSPVHVEPQVFDLIHLLAEAKGELVSYDQMIEKIWKGRIVSDATLAARISAARQAVGDSGKAQAVIKTVPRRGIQLVVPVLQDDVHATQDDPQTPPSAPHHTEQTIRYVTSADGTCIAYTASGDGPPMIRAGHFLTHLDLDWTSPIWRPLLDDLGRHHRVYRYDQRGTGLSDRNFSDDALDEFVEDLLAVIDQIGPDPIPIYSASQGVAVALRFAARYPDRVSRLVLYGGFAQGRFCRGDPISEEEARASQALIRAGWGVPGSPFLDMFTQLYAPGATKDQRAALGDVQLAAITAPEAARFRDMVDHFDVTEDLPKVRAPVLLLHVRDDRVHPLSQSRLIASKVQNAELVMLPGANHVPLPQDPAWRILMKEIERFLSDR